LDPNAAAANGSPIDEPESDEGEVQDYEAYYRDMDDKLSDGEEEYDGTTEDAPTYKKHRDQKDLPLANEDHIVVDLEEVLSPEEFEALYANVCDEGNDEQQLGSVTEDQSSVDREKAHVAEDDDDIQPEDMALFMGEAFSS
jgi:hypothetical protein